MEKIKDNMEEKEFCFQEGDEKYAGVHLLIEVWTKNNLTNPERIREIITKAVNSCGATMLSIDLHVFSPNGGVSGVAILHESHLSIHTWPEYNYAAIDLFVCGGVNPHLAVPVLKDEFMVDRIEVQEIKRGKLE